jgi:hypothetical protein
MAKAGVSIVKYPVVLQLVTVDPEPTREMQTAWLHPLAESGVIPSAIGVVTLNPGVDIFGRRPKTTPCFTVTKPIDTRAALDEWLELADAAPVIKLNGRITTAIAAAILLRKRAVNIGFPFNLGCGGIHLSGVGRTWPQDVGPAAK